MSTVENNGAFSKNSQKASKNFVYQNQLAERRYFKTLFYLALFALGLGSIGLLFNRPASVSISNAFLALGITWLGFLPSLLYLLDINRPPIPFFPLVGFYYATNYGLPMFATELQTVGRFNIENVTTEALVLVLASVAGMNLAFFASKSSLWKQVLPIRLPGPFPLGKLSLVLWVLLIAHLTFRYLPFIRSIPSVGQFLEPVGYLAFGMFYIIWARGKLTFLQSCLLLGVCVPLEIVSRLTSGLLSQVMLLILFMMIVVWYDRQRISISLISILLIVLLFLNPVKNSYRKVAWTGALPAGGFIERVEFLLQKSALFIELAFQPYTQIDSQPQNGTFVDSAIRPFVSRTAYIAVFSKVVEDTPERVPYWKGETYLPLFTSYIPRILWPDKPNQLTGNQFGHRYGFLDTNDFFTSFNFPWIVEMYANFGNLGVLIGMPLVGSFLAFLDRKFNQNGMNSLELVFGNTILFVLIYQESNFSLMVGATLNLSLSIYFLFKIILPSK